MAAADKRQEAREAPYSTLGQERLAPVLARLDALAGRPPQTLLLEGGNAGERLDLAKYWIALSNCEQLPDKTSRKAPCLACNICRQIGSNEFLDLSIHDGRISNKEDEENPGPIKALNVQRIRELKSVIATRPHGAGKRGVILMGLPVNRDQAANALLKTLEEPCPETLFVLLCSQRQQLLPTLVSRSFVLTVPWDDPHQRTPFPLENELVEFLACGRNFLDCIGGKGAVDIRTAEEILLGFQKAVMRVLGGQAESKLEQLLLKTAKPEKIATLSRWLTEAQSMLHYTVTPGRALSGLFTKIFCFLH